MSSFHDVLFPSHISYGSSGGPNFSTTVLELASGHEQRNINWSRARAVYDVSHNIKDTEDMDELLAFFNARYGRAYSFRFKDWADFQIGVQPLENGDGEKTDFQIIKLYTSGIYSYEREITKPVPGTLVGITVGEEPVVEGDDFILDYDTGIISFAEPPAEGAAVILLGVDFHVHARFDTDVIDAVHEFWNTQSWPSIPIKEVRE